MADTPQPQEILTPLTEAAMFLVLTVDPGGEAAARDLLPDVAALVRAVGFRVPAGRLSCITGIGSQLWDRLFAGPRPAALHPFAEIAGDRHRATATPGDLFFHIRAMRFDMCFELAALLQHRLDGHARVEDEVHGFAYFDRRDLLGFVDGTENPTGPDAAAAVLIGDEDMRFRNGSYVIVQRYVHDLDAWNRLSVEEQEGAVGRRKLNDVELPDGIKPANAHNALTSIEEDGEELEILRANMPFGNIGRGEYGTYFIGYARDPAVIERMLRNMFVGDPPGNTDRLLDFSTATTGSLYFVPSADLLDDLPASH